MTRSSLAALLVVGLYAADAGAPPPVSGFPAELAPDGTTAVPSNTRLWVFGEDAPPLQQVGATATRGGEILDVALTALGCCVVRAELGAPLAVDDEVSAVVTSAGGDVSATFVVDRGPDETRPYELVATVLDDSPGVLVLGVEGDDDVALAGFFARVAGEIVGAAPLGFTLVATRGDARCVDVVAVDLAGNESDPLEVCSALSPDDDPPPASDAPADDPGFSCAQSRSPSLWLALVAALALSRRRSSRP